MLSSKQLSSETSLVVQLLRLCTSNARGASLIPGSRAKILVVPANAGATGDSGLIPGLGRSLGEGNGNPLKHSCLENSMDRGAWQTTVHEVRKSWTRMSNLACFQQSKTPNNN